MIKITYKLILLLGLLAMTVTSFAASEAEYGKVSKAWTLHADGSQEYRSSMELTLFTHTAMNSTYGESFIVYNPDFQTLKIHSSYTRQKDGTIVKTPDNAFVEVLPRFAADAPAYNQLKEMVVVHTGLELGATIYLDYSIITKPGYYPALDINERLQETSPVKECKVSISVPEGTPLACGLYGSPVKAVEESHDGIKEVHWTLRNIPASSREAFQPKNREASPHLVASTYPSGKAALATLDKRLKESQGYESKTFAQFLTDKSGNEQEKVNIIRDHILNNLSTCPIPMAMTGYTVRDIDTVLRSAYGTPLEIAQLLNVMLNAAGIPSEVLAVYPGHLDTDACGLAAIQTLAVKATVDGKDQYLSASPLTNRGGLDKVVSLSGTSIEIETTPIQIKESRSVAISAQSSLPARPVSFGLPGSTVHSAAGPSQPPGPFQTCVYLFAQPSSGIFVVFFDIFCYYSSCPPESQQKFAQKCEKPMESFQESMGFGIFLFKIVFRIRMIPVLPGIFCG